MTEHFKRNHDTYSENFLSKLIAGGSLLEEIGFLKNTARKYINRANLAVKAEYALSLNKAWVSMASEAKGNRKTMGGLQQLERQLYDIEHDDLFIVAAFENYAKAKLLSKRYVVHTIGKPSALKTKQKKAPIHINTIRRGFNSQVQRMG